MTRTLTCRLPLVLLLLTFFALAATPVFAQRGQIYTVKKGDTLWDLSQRFIEDPYYWPNIWSDNPDISNPHLIFPGQQIRILDGRLEIIPAYADADQPPATDPPVASGIPTRGDALLTIRASGSGDGFILIDEQPLGHLLDSVDNRILLTETDTVFVKASDAVTVAAGDSFGLYQRGHVVQHPHSREKLGTLMYNLGFLTVTEVRGSTLVARIDGAYREVIRGAELFAYRPPTREISLRRGTTSTPGFIIAAQDEKGTISTNDMIFIDLGAQDGLATGNLLYISRPRQATGEAVGKAGQQLDLPDAVLGAAVVTDVRATTATAIVIKSVDNAAIGDGITVVTN